MIPDAVFTLDKAKAHLRVTHALEDALITAYLDGAVAQAERLTRRAWTVRTWHTVVDASDLSCACDCNSFHAELSPATAKVYADLSGVETELPATDFFMSTRYGHSVLHVRTWPTANSEGDAGRIEWSAKPSGDVVPPDVYEAVMLFLGDAYTNREAQVLGIHASINPAAEVLLRSYVLEMHA